MNRSNLTLLLCLTLAGLLAGCVSAKPDKFSEQVRAWVPIGTPTAEAQRIMEDHGFECRLISKDHPFNAYGIAYLQCDREQVRLHDWETKLFIEDGKVIRYGAATVDPDSP